MPNESQRITESALKGLSSMLFMLNSVDERTDIMNHPKYHIVINNVSKYGDNYDYEAVEKDPESARIPADNNLSVEKRIEEFKFQLKESVKKFHLSYEISEKSMVGTKAWNEIKS